LKGKAQEGGEKRITDRRGGREGGQKRKYISPHVRGGRSVWERETEEGGKHGGAVRLDRQRAQKGVRDTFKGKKLRMVRRGRKKGHVKREALRSEKGKL